MTTSEHYCACNWNHFYLPQGVNVVLVLENSTFEPFVLVFGEKIENALLWPYNVLENAIFWVIYPTFLKFPLHCIKSPLLGLTEKKNVGLTNLDRQTGLITLPLPLTREVIITIKESVLYKY